ncbi:MAG: molybdopterin-dependent oxidoreductase [Acidobacteriota bacterium]|jgi:CO/xanthine dehydrogenase Mo-binding subunit|nr:molybdopterin-dependent oxidoreductase [Acidobacteriota bacterium]
MADIEGYNGERAHFEYVGHPKKFFPGKLSYNLATGKAKYGADAVAPDMLFAKFLRSPYAHAHIRSLDASAAKAIPGVVDIVRWDDPDLKPLAQGGSFIGDTAYQEDQEVGAIVVAESEELCDAAIKALKIDWEERKPIVDPRDGLKEGAPVLTPASKEGKPNVTVAQKIDGDVEAGFKQADQIIEFDFQLPPMVSHIPNPSGGLSYWYDDDYSSEGKCLHLEGTVFMGASNVAGMYNIPTEKLRAVTLYQGGKYCDWGFRKSQLITPLLARRTGRPVRCVNKRENHYDFFINQHFVHAKVGFKNDGVITAVHLYSVADNGIPGSSNFGSTMDMNYGPWYTTRCLNITQIMDAVTTNRGNMTLSSQFCPFAWDTMTVAEHIIADKLGLDPIEVATRNLHGSTSQTDYTPQPSYQACIEAGKKMMNWQYHQKGEKKLPDGRMHGMAFRYQMCPRHAFSGYSATLYVKGGKLVMPTQGPCTGMFATEACAMVAAEEVGAKWEDTVIEYDKKAVFSPVGGGSDGTSASAWVMKECAGLLRKKLFEAVAPQLNAKPEELDAANSEIFVKSDPSRKMPLGAAGTVGATFEGRPPEAIWSQMGKALDTMNTLYCEVAVDTETGEVEVLKHGISMDPGKVLRWTSMESQIQQVMMFSEGIQLKEEFLFDPQSGVRLTANMFDYKKPTIVDIAPTNFSVQETRIGNAAYGSGGISHSMANTHIIICAIHNAIGKWVDPPATPARVLAALGKA